MPETPAPILVYNRIDANRRKTRLLLASFAVALLPVVAGGAVVIALPSIYIYPMCCGSTGPAKSLQALLWRYGDIFLGSTGIVALALMAATAFLASATDRASYFEWLTRDLSFAARSEISCTWSRTCASGLVCPSRASM